MITLRLDFIKCIIQKTGTLKHFLTFLPDAYLATKIPDMSEKNLTYGNPIADSLGSWGPRLNLSLCSLVNPALRSMLPNLSLVMEFLGNVFTNFIFEKLLSHEAWWREELQLAVTIKCSFVTRYIWKKLVRAIQAASTPSEANCLPKLFHILNHFH